MPGKQSYDEERVNLGLPTGTRACGEELAIKARQSLGECFGPASCRAAE